MYPANGTAFNTTFNVNCSVPFEDDDVPLTYDVGYIREPTDEINWIYQGFKDLSAAFKHNIFVCL